MSCGSVVIDPMKASDHPSVLALADQVFGKGYCHVSWFTNDLVEILALCARDKNQCIGFMLAWKSSIKTVEQIIKVPAEEWVVSKDGMCWYIKLICVRPEHRNNGIASKMIRKLKKEAKDTDFILTSVWQRAGHHKFPLFYTVNGFVPIAAYDDYWYEDSLKRGYRCPVCGIECHCTMRLAFLKM